MINVPNAKVLVIGGSLNRCVSVTIQNIEFNYRNNRIILVRVDAKRVDGAGLGSLLDIDIPPHMLTTSKIDFLTVFKKMVDGVSAADAVIETALEESLQLIRFDLTCKGQIICDIGLKIRGNLRCVSEYDEKIREYYKGIFDFKKKDECQT